MVTEQNRILFCYHFLLNSSAVQYRMRSRTVKLYRKRALHMVRSGKGENYRFEN